MTETITTLRVEDVYPNPKHYREVTPAGIDEMAASIAVVGQLSAIVVWRDGDIYIIDEGHHRVAALKQLGIETVEAIVHTEESFARMVGSNLHIPATEIERSRGTQLLLTTGVRPQEAAALTAETTDRIERAYHGMEIINDPVACEDLTTDRLIAVAEMDDDPEAVRQIITAPERDWLRVYNDFARARKADAALAEAKALIEAAGCTFTDKHPAGFKRISSGRDCPEGATMASIWVNAFNATTEISWYAPIGAETEAERAVREEREAKTAAHEAEVAERENDKARRLACVKEAMNPLSPHTHAVKKYAQQLWENGMSANVSSIPEALADVDGFTARVHAAVIGHAESNAGTLIAAESFNRDYYLGMYGKTTGGYFDFLKKCGYEMSKSEAAALVEIKRAAKKGESSE